MSLFRDQEEHLGCWRHMNLPRSKPRVPAELPPLSSCIRVHISCTGVGPCMGLPMASATWDWGQTFAAGGERVGGDAVRRRNSKTVEKPHQDRLLRRRCPFSWRAQP